MSHTKQHNVTQVTLYVIQVMPHHTSDVTRHTSDITCHTPGDDLVAEVEPLLQSVDVKHDNLCGPPCCHRDDGQHVGEGLGKGNREQERGADHMTFSQ